jgi:hypothetical protein
MTKGSDSQRGLLRVSPWSPLLQSLFRIKVLHGMFDDGPVQGVL